MPIQEQKLCPRKGKSIIFFQQTQKKKARKTKITSKMTGSSNHYTLISLNINGINSPIKRPRQIVWIHKQGSAFGCILIMHLSVQDKHFLRRKGCKTIFQANTAEKQDGVATLISDKNKLSTKTHHKR